MQCISYPVELHLPSLQSSFLLFPSVSSFNHILHQVSPSLLLSHSHPSVSHSSFSSHHPFDCCIPCPHHLSPRLTAPTVLRAGNTERTQTSIFTFSAGQLLNMPPLFFFLLLLLLLEETFRMIYFYLNAAFCGSALDGEPWLKEKLLNCLEMTANFTRREFI